MRRTAGTLALAVLIVSMFSTTPSRADEPAPDPLSCEAPVPDIDPSVDPAGWIQRDLGNLTCGYMRQYDEIANPAFMRTFGSEQFQAFGMWPGQIDELLREPTRPRINPTRMPEAKVADPFRMPDDWEANGRGQTQRFQFTSKTGVKQYARLFSPNVRGAKKLPGIVFSPGFASYNEVNIWFAEGMAESGYLVLIIDPQGQGDSESLSHGPDGSIDCSVPGCGLNTLFNVPGFQSAIDFFLSTPRSPSPWARGANAKGTLRYNPLWASLDRERLGIAGHSLGAIAATPIGQLDPRVKAVVAYDNLDRVYKKAELVRAHAPTLFFGTDYPFPTPPLPMSPSNPPDPNQHLDGFRQLSGRGVDAMTVTPRASAHYEWGYQPFPASFPASRYGERTSFYFTRAWFDRYLKGDTGAVRRLLAKTFDASADASSIGAGTFDAAQAAADPSDPRAGNVPYRIRGKCVANLLSFYFRSAYSLEHGRFVSRDMRDRGCG